MPSFECRLDVTVITLLTPSFVCLFIPGGRGRAKNMANQSNMQLSMLDIEQHELLLNAVAHKCMQLKRTINE